MALGAGGQPAVHRRRVDAVWAPAQASADLLPRGLRPGSPPHRCLPARHLLHPRRAGAPTRWPPAVGAGRGGRCWHARRRGCGRWWWTRAAASAAVVADPGAFVPARAATLRVAVMRRFGRHHRARHLRTLLTLAAAGGLGRRPGCPARSRRSARDLVPVLRLAAAAGALPPRCKRVLREFAMLAGISTVATSLDLLFIAVFSLGQFASLTLALFLALGLYAGAAVDPEPDGGLHRAHHRAHASSCTASRARSGAATPAPLPGAAAAPGCSNRWRWCADRPASARPAWPVTARRWWCRCACQPARARPRQIAGDALRERASACSRGGRAAGRPHRRAAAPRAVAYDKAVERGRKTRNASASLRTCTTTSARDC